jgi:hypothetical protein
MDGDHNIAIWLWYLRVIVSDQFEANLLRKHRRSAAPISVESVLVNSDDLEVLRTAQEIL